MFTQKKNDRNIIIESSYITQEYFYRTTLYTEGKKLASAAGG